MRLVKFKTVEGRDLYINPEFVISVKAAEETPNSCSVIYKIDFPQSKPSIVEENIGVVIRRLQGLMQ